MNVVHLCDCMDFMKDLPDKHYDLAIVDPPYGVGNFNQYPHPSKKYNKAWSVEWNKSPPNKKYFSEIIRASKEQIVFGANYYWEYLPHRGAIIWDKGNNSDIGSQAEIASCSLQTRVTKYFEKWTGFINSEKRKRTGTPMSKTNRPLQMAFAELRKARSNDIRFPCRKRFPENSLP